MSTTTSAAGDGRTGPPATGPQQQPPARLLLVEDDPGLAECLADAFSRSGWDVVRAGSYAEAQHAVGFPAEPFSVLVTDFDLGPSQPDGADVLRLVRSRVPSARRFLNSGLSRTLPDGLADAHFTKNHLVELVDAVGQPRTGTGNSGATGKDGTGNAPRGRTPAALPVEYVYGFGRRKHLKAADQEIRNAYRVHDGETVAVCGAYGGGRADTRLPVCTRCLTMSAVTEENLP